MKETVPSILYGLSIKRSFFFTILSCACKADLLKTSVVGKLERMYLILAHISARQQHSENLRITQKSKYRSIGIYAVQHQMVHC